jgi:branched-chain amino acid:cation transporter, LIVCS family
LAIGTFENGGQIFSSVAKHYFGPFGAILLAIIIVLACLKTSIGLITACSEFFHDLLPKISYQKFVLLLCIVSFTIANFGLNNIIQFAVPVLMFLYPLAIILILLTLISPLFGNKQSVYSAAIAMTFFVSFFDGYSALVANLPNINISLFNSVTTIYVEHLPLYEIGLGWIIPAFLGAVIGYILPKAHLPMKKYQKEL